MSSHFWIRKLFPRTHARPRNHRLSIDRFEERITPATFSEMGATLALDLDTVNEAVSVVSNGSSYTLTLTGGTWTGTNNAGIVTGNGTATLTVTADAFNTLNLTDQAGVASTAVTFANSGANSYSDTFNVTLDDAGAGAINFNGATSFIGTAALSASTSRNIVVNSGATVWTVDGNLSL